MQNAMMNAMAKVKGEREVATPLNPPGHPINRMNAIVWRGVDDIRYEEVAKPIIVDQRDVIVQVTASSICGSDLHLVSAKVPTMQSGDILGHEFMGIITEVGGDVHEFKKGDRVSVAAHIACGTCAFCKRQEYSACQATNPSNLQKENYGHNTAALFGFAHITGGVPGGDADFVRVPFADVNCLKLPDSIPDETALFLGDIIPTSYFGAEMGEVKEGDTVAIWGLGPVGLLCARWCQIRGASRVIGIDSNKERLDLAKQHLNIETINYKEQKTTEVLKTLFPTGIDVAIECAGFEYATSLLHKFEMAVGMETDTADLLTEMITCVRPFGHVSIIGVYVGTCNHFPIGALMEKGITMRGGPTPMRKFWPAVLKHIQSGEFDPRFLLTTRAALSETPKILKEFKDRHILKVLLRPDALFGTAGGAPTSSR